VKKGVRIAHDALEGVERIEARWGGPRYFSQLPEVRFPRGNRRYGPIMKEERAQHGEGAVR
jgi:hypothetical protein